MPYCIGKVTLIGIILYQTHLTNLDLRCVFCHRRSPVNSPNLVSLAWHLWALNFFLRFEFSRNNRLDCVWYSPYHIPQLFSDSNFRPYMLFFSEWCFRPEFSQNLSTSITFVKTRLQFCRNTKPSVQKLRRILLTSGLRPQESAL